MLKERIIQVLGIWLIISFFVLLFGITRWDLPPTTAVLFAGLLGFFILLQFGSHMEGGKDTVDEIASSDEIVVGNIEVWHNKKTIWYNAKVKRNYQDRVFAKEKEFEDVEEAKAWLAFTYQQELEKHQQYLHQIEQTSSTNNN